ncbi:MAG: Dephospho-CoA kinase-like protein [Parcubacteria group bacterium GW2011_GWC1_43_12]|nr:MAG: Dephospho-CoA kinase-like protein [Parcubacteria group bacterium GW2011_GWB1_42_6]KKS92074.1 MAG: Dephospho-CoA kinase-like protein [Parcubacteria group bacterium GW2011_GWC1_43_12]
MSKKIIAILGLPGSGKSEAINYLIKKYNWPKVYFGEVTFDEMRARRLEINEKNEREVREDLRAKYGQLHYAKQVIKKIEDLPSDVVLVESLYSWPEYLEFKNKFGDNFIAITVYSSPKTRYERLGKRSVRPLTPEEGKSRDYSQIENLTQANPIAIADYTVINEDSLEYLYRQLDQIIKNLL